MPKKFLVTFFSYHVYTHINTQIHKWLSYKNKTVMMDVWLNYCINFAEN